MKFAGFNGHRYGDLIMNTVAARCLKKQHSDSSLTFVINQNFHEIAPLFYNHPNIDKIYITNSEQGAFNQKDLDWIKNERFHYVFNPMQDHLDLWYQFRNQGVETARMHGLDIHGDDGHYELVKWWKSTDNYKKYVAFVPYAGSYHPNNKKMLKPEKAQEIVNFITNLGFNVLQLGSPNESSLENVLKLNTNFFESVRNMIDCKMVISTDTGLGHVAAAYSHPALGLYSNEYYGTVFVKNIKPVNKNALYLDSNNVNDIPNEEIFNKITQIIK